MTWALVARFLVPALVLTAGVARAGPCSPEIAKAAVEAAADTVGRLGVEAAKGLMDRKEGPFLCGPYSVKVMDYRGTWRIDPDESSNVGRNVESFGDGAATNFMKGLIKAAIESRGKMVSYPTTDTEAGVKINKLLYWIDIPQHKVIAYGAFIAQP